MESFDHLENDNAVVLRFFNISRLRMFSLAFSTFWVWWTMLIALLLLLNFRNCFRVSPPLDDQIEELFIN